MTKTSHKSRRLVLCCCVMVAVLQAAAQYLSTLPKDTVIREVPYSEFSNIHKIKKVSSRYPVEIRKKGSSLMVTSKHVQLLPVYKANGTFFGIFHLMKGTNWISGLPKGNYLINDIRISIL